MKGFTLNIARICSFTIAVTAVMTSTLTQAEPLALLISPYWGADAQIRHISWDSNRGSNIFKQDYIQGNIYGGLELSEFFGVELGYESTVPRTANNTLSTGETYLGTSTIGLTGPIMTEGRFQISGWHVDMVGYLPIITPENNVFLSVGAAYLRASHWATVLGDPISATSPVGRLYRSSAKRTVLRVGGGYEYIFYNCVGLRLGVAWENTARFKNLANDFTSSAGRVASLRNSWIYGLGVLVKF